MKLYCFQVAPNPTRVRLYLAEKRARGASLDVSEVSVNLPQGEHRTPAHLARNPLGALPVLELDDGSFLTQSLVIIDYLEELHPEPSMTGSGALERARVRETERIAETAVLAPMAQIVHSTHSPLGFSPVPEVAAWFAERLPAGLRLLDERLSDGRPFLMGERPTIADCTLAAAFQFGRFGKVELDPGYENLTRWDAHYRARPEVAGVLVF
jgi:glutathione S-transferase